MRQWLGSFVFTTLLFVSVAVWALVCLVLRLFGYRVMTAAVRLWARTMLGLLRWCCGLDHRVHGLENLPDRNTVVLMKHSSTWETIAQLVLFPAQTWVMKRELIWAPLLGWALYFLKPIAINRQGGRAAVEQVIEMGKQRLEEGLWVIIFPEGTRVPIGASKRFGLSGALLAQAANRPIVPVVHDAGRYWPRRGLFKRRGTIQVTIGKAIETAGRDARELTSEVQTWMEAEIASMTQQ